MRERMKVRGKYLYKYMQIAIPVRRKDNVYKDPWN